MSEPDRSKRRRAVRSDELSEPMPAGLYLLATPIGAADDVTLRGLDALRRADVLACEDTRVLRRLMDIHGIALSGRRLVAYHDHSGEAARASIVDALDDGAAVVYASDAGTPLVADPGYRLAEAARAAGRPVFALPGPSAVLAALSVAGLPMDRFSFCGFPPPKRAARLKMLETWRATPGTLVFFEAPHRIEAALRDMLEVFGARPAALVRELTKKFEEVRSADLEKLVDSVAAAPPKGELVVLVAAEQERAEADLEAIDDALRAALRDQTLKDAVRTVTEHLHASRKKVYERALKLSEEETP